MNLPLRILLSSMAAAWLIPVGLAWPRRYASPLWAWLRIVSGLLIFSWLELLMWRPQTRYLDYLFDVGALVFAAKFFVKRKISTHDF
jgi:hypothetical protein